MSLIRSRSSSAPGISAALQGGRTIVADAAGLADLSNSVPMTPMSLVNTGSIAKSVVGYLVRRALRAGRLTSDASVDDYLPVPPWWKGRFPLSALLQHRTGIWDYRSVLQLLGRGACETVSLSEVCRVIFAQSEANLPSVPTTDPSYSNSNYLLLGLVLESVYGRPLVEQVAELARDVQVEMRLVRSPRTVISRMARGYGVTAEGEFHEWRYWVDGMGASNLFASPSALLKWGEVLVNDDQESPTTDGYDFGRFKVANRWLVASGDDGGCRTSLVVDIESGSAACVAVIADDLDVQRLCMDAVGVGLPSDPTPPNVMRILAEHPVEHDPTGTYGCADLGHSIRLDFSGSDRLILTNAGQRIRLQHNASSDRYTDGHLSVKIESDRVLLSVNHVKNIPFQRLS